MSFVTNQAIRHLQTHGYRVMSLADPPDAQEAIDLLRTLGFQVFAPPLAPPVGSVWEPTRGTHRLKLYLSGRRTVWETTPKHVTYLAGSAMSDIKRAVTLRGWHEWVRRSRAGQIAL